MTCERCACDTAPATLSNRATLRPFGFKEPKTASGSRYRADRCGGANQSTKCLESVFSPIFRSPFTTSLDGLGIQSRSCSIGRKLGRERSDDCTLAERPCAWWYCTGAPIKHGCAERIGQADATDAGYASIVADANALHSGRLKWLALAFNDIELQEVIKAWDDLPAPFRKAILALVVSK